MFYIWYKFILTITHVIKLSRSGQFKCPWIIFVNPWLKSVFCKMNYGEKSLVRRGIKKSFIFKIDI